MSLVVHVSRGSPAGALKMLGHRGRALQRKAVATGHDDQLAVGRQLHYLPPERLELQVALTDDDRHGHRQLPEPVPQRRHLPRADPAQDRGEGVRAVAALVLARERVDLGRIAGEQRLCAPALDEVLERDALQLVGQSMVGGTALDALCLVLDPRGARHEHEPRYALGSSQRDVQRDAPPQRVAARHEALGSAREHVLDAAGERNRLPTTPARVGVGAMPGQIDRQRPVAFRGQTLDNAVPRAMGAAEPVQQDDVLRHRTIVISLSPHSLPLSLSADTQPDLDALVLSPLPHIATTHVTPATDTYLLLRAFVDELARCGMRVACTSPGSRCAPLVLTLARERRLRCYSHVDERCAGFFALGAAKASGLPVAVTCTSGTAAANFAPAVIEAHHARVPLIVLTADRPPELRDVGAGQTIDQLKLYGDAVKWFVEVGVQEAGEARLRWIRTLACRAYWTALLGRPGPVHLNIPLRESLVTDAPLPEDLTGRADGRPYVVRTAPD